MKRIYQPVLLVSVGTVLGFALHIQIENAEANPTPEIKPSGKSYFLSINEVRQNFVFFEEFSGTYKQTFTMSDGSVREIELTPVVKDGAELVQFRDGEGHTFMGPYGATTNGNLMVQVWDAEETRRRADASIAR